MEGKLQRLEDTLPGRSQQVRILGNTLFRTNVTVPCVFLYGASSTGKTFFVKKLFREMLGSERRNDWAYVDMLQCQHSARCLFEAALDAWSGTEPCLANGFATYARCDTLCDFVIYVQELMKGQEQTKFLVIDGAEHLDSLGGNLLPVLSNFSSVSRCPITVVLISRLSLDTRGLGLGGGVPYSVLFPEYSADDVLRILSLDAPEGNPALARNFQEFSKLIYDIFYKPCRDLGEVRHMTNLLWPKYIQPVILGQVAAQETGKLVRRMETHFRDALGQLHLRELSRIEWQQRVMCNLSQNDAQKAVVQRTANSVSDFDLPYYSKWLLISAYLASYNPAKYDVRYFTRHAELRAKGKGGKARRQKDMKGAEASGKLKQQLLGPRAFPLERMLAIYHQLIDTYVEGAPLLPFDVQSQVSTLVSLKLLLRVSVLSKLETYKCKCNVGFPFILQVSQQVHFDIVKYLYDFS